VFNANQMMIYGLTMLALAMTGAVLLVTSFVLGSAAAAVATTVSLVFFAAVWYWQPIRRRRLQARQRLGADT
jgi:membrane protein implicated in regulation of membrane protease activity